MLLRIIKTGSSDLIKRGKEKINKLRPRIDSDLPFNIKLGDIIDFDNMFLLSTCMEEAFYFDDDDPDTDHSYLELHCKIPDDKKEVVAIFKGEVDGFIRYWFYFENNDYLEITSRKENPTKPIEKGIQYFSFDNELVPEGNEDELYLPNHDQSNTWWIGNKFFPLPDQDVDEEGVWTQFAYARMWGKSEDLIPPKRIYGEIFTDPFRKKGISIEIDAMLYARTPVKYALDESLQVPEGEVEVFQIQAVNDSSGLYVQTYFGVNISENNFDVINMNV